MKELFFCPDCGCIIDMNAAVCSACGSDVSVLTGVKPKGTQPDRPRPETGGSVENEEADEEEEIDEEEKIEEKHTYPSAKALAQRQGCALGRWFKRMLFVALSAFGVWIYQQVGGIEGMKSLLSSDGKTVTEQSLEGQSSAEGSPVTDQPGTVQPGTVQPAGDKLTDLVNSPEGGTEAITIGDFAGEWNPENLNPGSTARMSNEHIIIKRDGEGTMVICFTGYESSADLLNYKWSALKGRKVLCKMTYKDNAENAGVVLMELSADKEMLSYSTLDGTTLKVKNTHKFKRE